MDFFTQNYKIILKDNINPEKKAEMTATCSLTESGSRTPSLRMSSQAPEFPLMPQSEAPAPPAACLARRAVRTRMVLAPQLAAIVRGMISSAVEMALKSEKNRHE